MQLYVDQLEFLGLSSKEARLFATLSTFGQSTLAQVAKKSGVPRSTSEYTLKKLVEQGVVRKVEVGKHYEYVVDMDAVADRLDRIEQRLRSGEKSSVGPIETEHVVSVAEESESIVEFKDVSAVDRSVAEVFSSHSGDRVQMLLGQGATGQKEVLDRLIVYLHEAVRTSTRLEVLLCMPLATLIRDDTQVPLVRDADLLRFNIVPASYCMSETDVLVFPDTALLRHTSTHTVLYEKNHYTVESLKHLLAIACETGWSVNVVAWQRNGE
jgi:sugar-specific transcriptional regulator TrmB